MSAGPAGATADSGAAGRLVVVSGPSGVGKGTVVRRLRESDADLRVSVSATTRAPRAGETDGVDYHFLSPDEFAALVAADGFLEWAEFNGHRYGTPWTSVARAREDGHRVVLEIEVQGALQVRDRFPDAVLIFLSPPTVQALEERLRKRGTDDDDRIAQRLAIARGEIAQAHHFDHVVVNDTVEAAVAEISRILAA